MSYILGIDPGTTETAYCLIGKNYEVQSADKLANEDFLNIFLGPRNAANFDVLHLVVESIQSYGMTVGREVFETAYMIGRIIQKAKDNDIPYTLYPRPEYAKAICGVQKVNDAVLRQALLLRFGGG